MAESRATKGFVAQKRRFDLRELARVTLWGVTAAAAVTLAAVASTSDIGETRMLRAISTMRGLPDPQTVNFADKAETRRLAEAVRVLGADRERLANRLAALEQTVDGVTGSIASATPAPAAPVAALPMVEPVQRPVPPPAHHHPAATATPAAKIVLPMMLPTGPLSPPASTSSVWAGVPLPRPAPASAAQPASPAAEVADIPSAKTEFGVDLGGAPNLEGLRALWAATKAKHAALSNLRPVMSIRESRPGAIELRLVVGPIANATDAARLCATLAGASCHPTVYDGQRLALR